MKKQLIGLLGTLALTAALAGCGDTAAAKPAAIQAGVDKCDVCNMMVPDDHNATEIVLKDGKTLKFDDIGCEHVWTEKNGKDQISAEFVRDYHSKEWVNLEKASFVYDKNFKTPMAYGIYSFKDQQSAQGFLNEQGKGKLMTAKELESHSWERNMEMVKEKKMQNMQNQNMQNQNMQNQHMQNMSGK